MLGIGTYRLAHPYDIVRKGLDLGYRLVDTAELYRNEKEVFRAVTDSGLRSQVTVMSKIRPDQPFRHSATDVDVLLLHWPSENPTEQWRHLCEKKPVKHLGVSNFSVTQLEAITEIATPFCHQIEVSPFLTRSELIAHHQAHGILTVAHSPLTKGERLSYGPLIEMANRYGTSPVNVLLSWSLAQGFWVLPRTSRLDHLQSNIEKNVTLSQADLELMQSWDDGFATHPKYILC